MTCIHMTETPDWLTPGSPVVMVTRPTIGGPAVEDTTIKKINVKSVTLANGERFPLGGTGRLHRYNGTWNRGSDLYPPDAPEVGRVRDEKKLHDIRERALSLADRCRRGVPGDGSDARAFVLRTAAAFTAWAKEIERNEDTPHEGNSITGEGE